jgi:hypothetical protein
MRFYFFGFLVGIFNSFAQDFLVLKGIISAEDSAEIVPFAYVYAKSTGQGVMSNLNGFFQITIRKTDTLMVRHSSYFGYSLPVQQIPDTIFLKIQLKRKIIPLPEVRVMDYSLKPYEKERMEKIIRQSRISVVSSINSPITALYYAFSRRGQELRKLSRIYEEILLEEKIREKLSPATLQQLTGDNTIDYDAFRKFCFEIKNEDFLFLDNYTLYKKVLDCYRRYKKERR